MATDKSKEAMKLALEALQEVYWSSRSAKHDEAITALREALAEQPAQRKPLTDEEIEEINVSLTGRRDLARMFARAVEAKLKERNT